MKSVHISLFHFFSKKLDVGQIESIVPLFPLVFLLLLGRDSPYPPHFAHSSFPVHLDPNLNRSVVTDSATLWTRQSMEFSRPEYWNG